MAARRTIFNQLPAVYQKFFKEWKYGKQTPVHYIEEPGKWKCDPETGEVKIIQNRPIPVTYPAEYENCFMGGEGLIKGFQKRHPLRRRVPHFWFPTIQTHVIYSEILDKHMEVLCTRRFLRLVDQHFGFDSYILETSPQDLKTIVAIKIKRTLLLALAKQDFLPNNPAKRDELLERYKKHIIPAEEAEWYGLTFPEALEKFKRETTPAPEPIVPLKYKFREEFIQNLRELSEKQDKPAKSWSSWNPFSS